MKPGLTPAELTSPPVATAHQLARTRQFPCPVIRTGNTCLVPAAGCSPCRRVP